MGITELNRSLILSTGPINPPWSMYKHDTNVNAILELQNGIIVNYIGNWQSNCKSLNFEWRTDCSKGIVVQKKQFDDLNFMKI